MSWLELTLRNGLKEGEEVRVMEGNAGMFRHLATLKLGETCTVRHGLNETFREFRLITLPSKKELPVLSTDLFHEFKEIIVFKDDETNTYDWIGTPRVARPAAGEALQGNRQGNRRGGRVATAWHRFVSKFGL